MHFEKVSKLQTSVKCYIITFDSRELTFAMTTHAKPNQHYQADSEHNHSECVSEAMDTA